MANGNAAVDFSDLGAKPVAPPPAAPPPAAPPPAAPGAVDFSDLGGKQVSDAGHGAGGSWDEPIVPSPHRGLGTVSGALLKGGKALAEGARTPKEGDFDQFGNNVMGIPIPSGVSRGVVKDVGETMTGLGHAMGGKGGATPDEFETNDAMEATGKIASNLVQFLGGEEIFKALSLSDRLMKVAQFSRFLEKFPAVGQALEQSGALLRSVKNPAAKAAIEAAPAAARQGAVAGAQKYVQSGGDTAAALETGALTGGAGIALAGAGGAAADAIRKRAATLEDVGGGKMVKATSSMRKAAVPTEEVSEAARGTMAQHLEAANEANAASPVKALPSRTGPYTFELQGIPPEETATGQGVVRAAEMPRRNITGLPAEPAAGSESERNIRELGSTATATPPRLMRDQPYMTSPAPGETPESVSIGGGGTLRTENADLVRSHIGQLNDAIDSPEFAKRPAAEQQQIRAARSDAQRQMSEYHETMRQSDPNFGRPHFPQLNVPQEISRVNSYTDVANRLQDVASKGFKYMDDISGGKFSTVRRGIDAAWDAVRSSTSEEGRVAALSTLKQSQQRLNDLLDKDLGGAVSRKELQGFRDTYAAAQNVRRVADVVDDSFNGNPYQSNTSWRYQGLDGNKLDSGLRSLEKDLTYDGLSKIVGKDHLAALHDIAANTRSQEGRSLFNQIVSIALKHPTRTGLGLVIPAHILGGPVATTGVAAGWVANKILSSPTASQYVAMGIEKGLKPEVVGPFVAQIIQASVSDKREEEQQRHNQGMAMQP